MTTGKVTTIVNDNFGRPVLINFENGSLNSDNIDNLQSRLCRDQDHNLIPVVASNENTYSCKIARKEELCNNYILTRNRKTGECKIIAVDSGFLKDVTKSKRKHANDEDISRIKQLSKLKVNFGSKRIKRATEQYQRLAVNIDTIKTTLEQTAKETHVDEADIAPTQPDENDNAYKPPINRNASTIEDVYPLSVLVPDEVLEGLKEGATELLTTNESDLKLCDFIKREFVKLQRLELSESDTRPQLLLYIDCLINFLKLPARALSNKKIVTCSYSNTVSNHILNNFTAPTTSGRSRPLSMRDKCVSYILALSMNAFKYTLNLEDFSAEIKLGSKKLQEISRVLCFTSKSNNRFVVSLTLPLPAPAVSSPRRKRK